MSTIAGQIAVAINRAIKYDNKASRTQTFSHTHKSTKLVQISMEEVSDMECFEDQSSECFVSAGFIFILKVWPPPDQLDLWKPAGVAEITAES